MDKIYSLLGRNSLRVNYFSFFIISIMFNVLGVFLPFSPDVVFGINIAVMQILKFFMIFSIAMYVTENMKVVRTVFWLLLVVNSTYALLGLSYIFSDVMKGVVVNAVIGVVLSLIYLLALLLLLRNAQPKMKSIVAWLFALELYQISKPYLTRLLSTLPEDLAKSEFLVIFQVIIPFLIMIPLFILIAQRGKEKKIS